MVTQEQYEFACRILNSDFVSETAWAEMPSWAKEICNNAFKILDAWEQQEYDRKVAEDPDYFPF